MKKYLKIRKGQVTLTISLVLAIFSLCIINAEASSGSPEMHVIQEEFEPVGIAYPQNSKSTKYLNTYLGADENIVDWLEAHEYDGYYLGTRFCGVRNGNKLSCVRPSGEYTTEAGMNCTGFVASVMRCLGGDLEKISTRLNNHYANACNWNTTIDKHDLKSYRFTSISAMLKSGKLEKGDIIYFEPDWSLNGTDCHIGVFWGDSSNDDKFWHSATGKGNIITNIQSVAAYEYVYIFKTQKKGTLKIYASSANEKYELYNGQNELVSTLIADENGIINAKNINVGEYYLKEVLSGRTYDIEIKNGEITVEKHNEELPGCEHVDECDTEIKTANLDEDGAVKTYCSICQQMAAKEIIPQIDSVKLAYRICKYNGGKKAPSVEVVDVEGKKLLDGEDYFVEYEGERRTPGRYKVLVTFQGRYSGSKECYFTIQPLAPKNVTTNLYGYDDVKISWDPVQGATEYQIYYKKSSSANYVKLVKTKKLEYNKSNLSDGVSYSFKVIPLYNVAGKNLESTYVNTSKITTLKKISTPKVEKYSSKKIRIKWSNIYGESGYQISRSTSKKGTNIIYTYKTTSAKSKTLSVKRGKTYYYKVRAYRAVNGKKVYGPWSNVKSYKLK